MEPRWVSVTARLSDVVIVTTRPWVGTVPAKDTVPPMGARTLSPVTPPMSRPRC
jgi:hypothetical protein